MAKDFIARCIAASNEGGGGESYVLPKATATRLGGIKVGDGLSIDSGGVLSADGGTAYELPPATASELGGVKVGSGLNVAADGTLSNGYELPTAAAGTLGGVKVGNGLSIDGNGVLSATGGGAYTLPPATANDLGGIKVGSGLSVEADGTLSATGGGSAYVLPPATANDLGGVKVGTGLNVAADGTLSNGITLPQDLSARLEALETQCVGQTGLTQVDRLKLRVMTKAQYEALPSHDNSTLYVTQDIDAAMYVYVGDTLLNNGGGWLGSVVVTVVPAFISVLIATVVPCTVLTTTEQSTPVEIS